MRGIVHPMGGADTSTTGSIVDSTGKDTETMAQHFFPSARKKKNRQVRAWLAFSVVARTRTLETTPE